MVDCASFPTLSPRRTLALVSATAVLASATLGSTSAHARPVQLVKQVTRLTTGLVERPRIQQVRGEFITFVSDGDVMGPGTEHPGQREVYLWSLEGDALRRMTQTMGGESFDASRVTDDFRSKRLPYIAFVSTGDLDPAGDNADGNPELFLVEVASGAIRQLTDTAAPVVNALPHPSDTGNCILFESTGDLDNNPGGIGTSGPTGYSNADGSREVFYLDFHTNAFDDFHFTQVSDGPPGTSSGHGTVGGYFYFNQCHTITYQSDHDQTGAGTTGTNVYRFNRQTGTTKLVSVGGLADAESIEPVMSGAGLATGGPSVVFASDADLFGRSTGGFQIYKMATLTGFLKQATSDPHGGHRRPTVSDGSSTVFFDSDGEPADPSRGVKRGPDGPHNADGNREIVRLLGKRRVQPITRTTGCDNDFATINGNGRAAAFRSDCELVPGFHTPGQAQVFAFYEARLREPLFQADACGVGDACCSTINGCFEEVVGRNYRPSRVPASKR